MGYGHTITERENVLRVLNHSDNPEWVPITEDAYEFVVPQCVSERPPFGTDGLDWFGCDWVFDPSVMGFAPNVKKPPLIEDITQWRDVVTFPNLDDLDWEGSAKKDLAEVDQETKMVRIIEESGVFERTTQMLGFENCFEAMLLEPESYADLVNALADYKIKLHDKIIEYYHPDEIFLMDDLGTANGLMMSPTTYRELLKPAHIRISEAIRSKGVFHTHHSCGKMEDLLQDLIETGANQINPVQCMNNWTELAAKYSDKIVFNTSCDARFNYPETTEEELRADVREVIDIFGPYRSLIIFCFVTDQRCVANMEIYLDEARSYGADFYKRH